MIVYTSARIISGVPIPFGLASCSLLDSYTN